MTIRADATAAPVTRTIGGRKLRLRPPTDKDYGEFSRWVQSEHIDCTKRNLDGLTDAQQNHVLEKAFSEAARMDITSTSALKKMVTVDGASFLLWVMTRPFVEITYEECRKLLFDNPIAIEAAMDVHDELTRGSPKKKRTTKDGVRKPTKRETRKRRKKST